jgi:hypothetical protein
VCRRSWADTGGRIPAPIEAGFSTRRLNQVRASGSLLLGCVKTKPSGSSGNAWSFSISMTDGISFTVRLDALDFGVVTTILPSTSTTVWRTVAEPAERSRSRRRSPMASDIRSPEVASKATSGLQYSGVASRSAAACSTSRACPPPSMDAASRLPGLTPSAGFLAIRPLATISLRKRWSARRVFSLVPKPPALSFRPDARPPGRSIERR